MGGKAWTLREEEYLTNNYDKLNIEIIMRKLNKTYFSIKRKANMMGLERNIFEDGLYMSTMEVMEILGCAKSTIRLYVDKGYIKVKKFKSFNKEYNKFSVEGIINFMVSYPDKWKDREYDKDMLQLLFLDYHGNAKNIEFIKSLARERDSYWRKDTLRIKSEKIS